MTRFIEGEERSQSVLFPERLEDWISEDNPVRVVDVFIDELDLKRLGFEGAMAAETGPPRLSPGHAAQDLRLWVSQSDCVEPASREGMPA